MHILYFKKRTEKRELLYELINIPYIMCKKIIYVENNSQ